MILPQARHGHREATEYLLSKGADMTLEDDYGDTALTVAKTSSIATLIKGTCPSSYDDHSIYLMTDAWHSVAEVPGPMEDPPSIDSEGPHDEPETPVAHNKSFFITDRQVSGMIISCMVIRLFFIYVGVFVRIS